MIYLGGFIVISMMITAFFKISTENFLDDNNPERFLIMIGISIGWPLIIAIGLLALPAGITYCSPEILKEFIKWYKRMNQERKIINSANRILNK